jgi:hypothetical protein
MNGRRAFPKADLVTAQNGQWRSGLTPLTGSPSKRMLGAAEALTS